MDEMEGMYLDTDENNNNNQKLINASQAVVY